METVGGRRISSREMSCRTGDTNVAARLGLRCRARCSLQAISKRRRPGCGGPHSNDRSLEMTPSLQVDPTLASVFVFLGRVQLLFVRGFCVHPTQGEDVNDPVGAAPGRPGPEVEDSIGGENTAMNFPREEKVFQGHSRFVCAICHIAECLGLELHVVGGSLFIVVLTPNHTVLSRKLPTVASFLIAHQRAKLKWTATLYSVGRFPQGTLPPWAPVVAFLAVSEERLPFNGGTDRRKKISLKLLVLVLFCWPLAVRIG